LPAVSDLIIDTSRKIEKGLVLPPVGYPPDRAVPVFAKKEAAIFCDRDPGGPAPGVTFGSDEAGDEIFVIAITFSAMRSISRSKLRDGK
jgi:hypothetical protein